MNEPLLPIARKYANLQQNLLSVRDNVAVFVSDSSDIDDPVQLGLGVMNGRIVEITFDQALFDDFADEDTVLAAVSLDSYINMLLLEAFDNYSAAVSEYMTEGVLD